VLWVRATIGRKIMKRLFVAGGAVLAAVVLAVPLWLALDDDGVRRTGALVTPTGTGEIGRLTLVGKISGTVVVPVRSFDLEVRSPRDAATGQTKGSLLYKPLAVIKPIDPSSPTLFKMLVNNEGITSAKLELTTSGEKPGVYMAYDFTGAAIREWRDTTAETISMTYQTVASKPGGVKPPAGGAAVIGQLTYGTSVVPITGFETGLDAPYDSTTGALTGKRQHSAASVMRPLDGIAHTVLSNLKTQTSPTALKVELQRTTADGKPETYATYTYGTASLAAVNDAGAAGDGASQRFEITYASIEVKAGTAVASDSWAATAS
jgi:type VI protein secretion system component Hcp